LFLHGTVKKNKIAGWNESAHSKVLKDSLNKIMINVQVDKAHVK